MIEDSLARGEAALIRAGQSGGLAVLRAELEVRAGRLDHAVELLRGELARPVRWLTTGAPNSQWAYADAIRTRVIDLLARLGRHAEAIDEAHELVAWGTKELDDNHIVSFYNHVWLERALVRAGRVAEAFAETDREIAILVAIQLDQRLSGTSSRGGWRMGCGSDARRSSPRRGRR